MPTRKKDPSVRARANVASTARTLPAQRTGRVRVPALVRLPKGQSWHPSARAWWNATWRSPMAVEYLDADRHTLNLMALLVNDFYWADSHVERQRLAAEIRLQRAPFGLTPYDRLRLEWSIHKPDTSPSTGEQRPVNAPTGTPPEADDPRRGLHAV